MCQSMKYYFFSRDIIVNSIRFIADRIDIDVGIKYGGSLSTVKYTTSVSI